MLTRIEQDVLKHKIINIFIFGRNTTRHALARCNATCIAVAAASGTSRLRVAAPSASAAALHA